MTKSAPALLLALALSVASAGAAETRHPELGTVKWGRDYDAALAAAQKQDKPVFLLFQEVPGCAGCQQFGAQVLSDPALVKQIEEQFVPVAIFNNQGGRDREILRRYQEPSWNFQVVRFVDATGRDLIPRRDRVWTVSGIAGRMARALEAAGKPVPPELRRLAGSGRTSARTPSASWVRTAGPAPAPAETPATTKTAAFAMYCFWDGEARLGRLDGVVTTEAGWLEGREVVKLSYDPARLDWSDLVRAAEKVRCADRVYAPGPAELAAARELSPRRTALFPAAGYRKAKESDQRRVLRASPLRALELTPEQATKVNAALRFGGWTEVQKWLTPEQVARARELAGK
ncbi:MAG: thioredoxin family protein [Verrucomicrobiota bacterium]